VNFFVAGSVFSVISFDRDSRHRFQPIIIKNQRWVKFLLFLLFLSSRSRNSSSQKERAFNAQHTLLNTKWRCAERSRKRSDKRRRPPLPPPPPPPPLCTRADFSFPGTGTTTTTTKERFPPPRDQTMRKNRRKRPWKNSKSCSINTARR
jgi:hypothetical protein